jgi:ribonuclease E
MSNKMLIDASHEEETRVVVFKQGRIEEFDLETQGKNQIRGNIYLAKVTRVEPSLQAAFVEYGGNRHGFLAFSEIHPDYYQIPISDREELSAQEELANEDQNIDIIDTNSIGAGDSENINNVDENSIDDISDEIPKREIPKRKRYKIQEVIKKRQIILIQVTKEERGNKGAALTTYLSLAGRYCVLMPNTARGGGISRKITSMPDRSRLREIVDSLKIPKGTGVIVRTAGSQRTKTEIKRDFEYLLRLWETIRELTLNSTAPAIIYEEGSLIKRSIRDLYNKDIDEILISGDEAYNEAKSFMKMLIPSHIKFVKKYEGDVPLFSFYHAENQLREMFVPNVTLPSGGYLVINQTEALVAIDVNSGRSTREHNIEDTALRTNLESSDEIARQLRLRDLAGLIVIDYIDMEEKRNNRSVERRLKDALKIDRARIQVGHISQFGLLEMSRQRMRSSVIESSMIQCDHCMGSGRVNSVSSSSLQIVRSIEESILANGPANINIKTNSKIGFYTLNNKRSTIVEIENRNNILVNIEIDDSINEEIFILTRDVSKDSAIKKNASAISMNTVYEKPEIPESNKDIDSNKNLQITPENRSRSGNRRKNIRQKVSNDSIALDAKNSALTSSKNINEDKIVKSNSKDTEVDITKTKTTNTQRNYKSNVKKIENKVNENKIENVEKITKKIVQNKPKHIKPNQNKVKEEEPKNIKSIEKKVKKEEPKNIKSIEKKVEEEEPKIKKTGWWDS